MDTNIKPLDMNNLSTNTKNIYKTVAVLGLRANQIASKMKQELNEKLAEFQTSGDTLEEVVENREQIEIAKFYESLPKPTLIAIDEYQRGEVTFTDPNEEVSAE